MRKLISAFDAEITTEGKNIAFNADGFEMQEALNHFEPGDKVEITIKRKPVGLVTIYEQYFDFDFRELLEAELDRTFKDLASAQRVTDKIIERVKALLKDLDGEWR